MNALEALDRLWERHVRPRLPAGALADATDDQSHVHHALVTILIFGGLGILVAAVLQLLVIRRATLWVLTTPLAAGVVFGWAFYVAREVSARWGNWRYKRWDGIGDVLVPLAWTAPWTLAALARGVPWWTGALLYAAAAGVALLYFFFRPVPKDGAR